MTESIIQKTCLVCYQTFPITNFHKHKTAKDGVRNQCKTCVRNKQKTYEQNLQARKTIPELIEKRCCGCKEIKPISKFSKNSSKKDGYTNVCKICAKKHWSEYISKPEVKSKINKKSLEKYHTLDGKRRFLDNFYKRTFGISLEDYEKIFQKQQGKCAICKEKPNKCRFAVDHCHVTGKVRGLLCGKCNTGLGLFLDNKELLNQAIIYLESQDEPFHNA